MLLCCITLSSSRENQHSAQEITRSISGAIVGESTQKSTYQVPITNPYLPHYIICHLPLVLFSPPSPLPFYLPSLSVLLLFPYLPLFARFFFACVLDRLLVVMASPLSSPLSPENEVLNFKQREGENLKDAWYRICNAQNRSTRKQSTSVLLRNFYVGATPWYRYILDTITGGNFLGSILLILIML